jgi:hypothetical protein
MEAVVEEHVSPERVEEVLALGQTLRRRLGALAASIATTEDQMAGTLERLALSRPSQASRLLARATRARQYAALERDRAADYGHDPRAADTAADDAR